MVTVAEDGSERPAPVETLAQSTSPAADTLSAASPQQDSPQHNDNYNVNETDSPRGESMTTARERFFGQVFRMLFVRPCISINGSGRRALRA